jgi:hypothetical protein
VHTWLAWQGSALAADQAQPTRRGLGKSSLVAASQHREHPPGTLPPVPLSHHNHRRAHCKYRKKNHRTIELGGDRIRWSLSQGWQGISSEMWRPPNPPSGRGRAHWGASFAPGGSGGSHRRWPESPSDGGGD